MKLSVIVPFYNEKDTLGAIVSALRAVPVKKQIVLVDDCSADGSCDVMESLLGDADNDSSSYAMTPT